MARLIILDFDGTMTDAEQEGAPFREGYLEDLATLADRPLVDIHRMADAFGAEIAARQAEYGWMYNGRIVAPASVDPYLRIMPVARKILDACGTFMLETERSRLLDSILYKYNYQKTAIAFREGALELLLALRDMPDTEVYVVTNSHTEPVAHKIRLLGERADGSSALDWLLERVHGRAKKYVIDDAFTGVEASMRLPGLDRPVLLRRRHYAETLEALRSRHGAGWDDVTVVGDIFELDLALPLALGARAVLVANDHTPAYEQAFVAAHPRAKLARGLGEVQGMLRG
jgi:FMN phosphatase YigB (HAD superfamily)